MAETHHSEFKLIGPEKPQRAHVSVGSEITVPCRLSPEISTVDMEIKWFKETDCVCLYKNRQAIEGRGYERRVSLSNKEKGKVSLLLREFRGSDFGDYLCQVTSGDKIEEITVRVSELCAEIPTEFPGHKMDVAKGALGMCKIQTEKINRAWTKEERRKMKESGLIAVQLQGMDFGQVVEVLLYESDIRNKLQKQLEGRKQHQQKHVSEEVSTSMSPVMFPGSELRLALLGRSGLEKRAAGNMILSREERSQTGTFTEIQQSESRQGEVAGRKVTVVETPDWFCSGLSLEELRQDVKLCLHLSAPGPHTFLLVIPMKESAGEMLEKMEDIFGERCWRNTMILFTVTDEEQKKNTEDFVQSGNLEVQRLVEKCENRFYCLNINKSADDSQVSQVLKKIDKMVTGNTERFYSSEIYLAFQEMVERIEKEINKLKKRQQREIRENQEREIQEAFQRFTDKIKSLEENICQIEERITNLERKIKEEKDEAKIKELQKDLEREKEQRLRAEEKLRESREKWEKERSEIEDRYQQKIEEIKEMYEGEVLPELQKNVCNFMAKQQKYFNFKMEEKDTELEAMKCKLSESQKLLHLAAPIRRRNSMDEPPVVSPKSSIPSSPVFALGSELKLVLLGRSELEKKATGNMILGRKEKSQTGTSTEIQQSESRQGEVAGRKVTVVETPDWFCSGLSLEELRRDAEFSVCLSAPGPNAFLLVIPVKESAGEDQGMLEKMEEILVERCWKNTVILFTVTDEEKEKNIEKFIQSGHQDVQRLVEKCENRFHCLNISQSGDDSQVLQLLEKIEKMVAENTDRFHSSDIYLHESQIQELERKLRRETEERDTFGRQIEEKEREIQTLIQKLSELKTIQVKEKPCIIS